MKNNYDIFKILKPNENIMLTDLNYRELDKIIYSLAKYYLELRKSIGNYPNDTAGFEFEFEDADKNKIIHDMINYSFDNNEYRIYEDDSIPDGYEICTPVLNLSNINWDRIKDLCYIIKKHGYIGNNCGAHIHIGAQILDNRVKSVTNFATLIIAYENVLARFFYGNFINERLAMHTYAPSVASDWYDEYLHFESKYYSRYNCNDIISFLSNSDKKNHFINLLNANYLGKNEINNTFEYRAPNGTLDPIIWQNNLNLIVKLMKYCNKTDFNLEVVEERIRKNIINFNNYRYYRSVNLEDAIELCDLIFANNLDKIYFLRQYIKDRNITNSKVLVLSKKFTETLYNDNDVV